MSRHLPELSRAGTGEPLFLLHGVTGSAAMWRDVVPILGRHHDAIAPSALGHHGGRPARYRPVKIEHLLDDLELTMDRLGIETAHFAGNSMGGWMALEMARRGRARTVCALLPGGTWPDATSPSHRATRRAIKLAVRTARLSRPFLRAGARSSLVRRASMRSVARRGGRIAPELYIDIALAAAACTVVDDVLATQETLAPLDAPCPISIVWSEHDRILPLGPNGHHARELVAGADFSVLPRVGHVPMLDDPRLVARTILERTGAAGRSAA